MTSRHSYFAGPGLECSFGAQVVSAKSDGPRATLYLVTVFENSGESNPTTEDYFDKEERMSEQFEQIKEGMLQAISHAKDHPVPGTCVHHPKAVDVKALRVGIGMTQEQFVAEFGVSTATLRHWERK